MHRCLTFDVFSPPQRDAKPLFLLLQDRYRPLLERNPTLGGIVLSLGLRYYSIEPPVTGMAAMMKGVMGMLGGGGAGDGGAAPTERGMFARGAGVRSALLAGGSSRVVGAAGAKR